MSHLSFLVTFPHHLRPDLPLRADRIPVAGESLLLDGEHWIVNGVEWATRDDRFTVHPTLRMRPSWGLEAELRALAAAASAPMDPDPGA